jgi:hypothetical protein
MFQPMKGNLKTSAFDTHLNGTKSLKARRISSCDWWLETIIYVFFVFILLRFSMETDQAGITHRYMDAQKEENKCRITSLRSNLKVIEYSIRAIKNIVAEETAIKVKKIIEMSLLMIYLPYF